MSFFSKLSRYNKAIFWVVLFFAVCTLLANVLKLETTPFFVWGMYSEKEEKVDGYKILEVIANDSIRVDYSRGFTDANRFYLVSPLTYSWQILENGGVDPQESDLRKKTGNYYRYIDPLQTYLYNDSADLKAFQKWYPKYLEGTTGIKIFKLQINVLDLVYNDKGQPELKSKTALAKWNL